MEEALMKRWCELAESKLSACENVEIIEFFEKLAIHYEDLAKEARTFASRHRALLSATH